ncbi:MAG: hypothetical protein ACFFFB_08190 [Candidatus Heimdallarchaeota archaeon]
MKISGSGTLSEGRIYDELNASGSVKLKGNFECDGFHSSGSLRGEGNLIVHGDIESSGSFRLIGSLYGDNNYRSSGSTSIEGEIIIKGEVVNSGSLRVGNNLEAIQGIRISGSTHVKGGLKSKSLIKITGSSTIYGDINGFDISLGRKGLSKRSIYKHPNKVFGSVYGRDNIYLINCLVENDVKGRKVYIGPKTEVLGTVYYVDTIQVDVNAVLKNKSVQIKEEELID